MKMKLSSLAAAAVLAVGSVPAHALEIVVTQGSTTLGTLSAFGNGTQTAADFYASLPSMLSPAPSTGIMFLFNGTDGFGLVGVFKQTDEFRVDVPTNLKSNEAKQYIDAPVGGFTIDASTVSFLENPNGKSKWEGSNPNKPNLQVKLEDSTTPVQGAFFIPMALDWGFTLNPGKAEFKNGAWEYKDQNKGWGEIADKKAVFSSLSFFNPNGNSFSAVISPQPAQALSFLAAAPIPEPQTYALLLAGLGAVGFMARRRRAQ